MASKQGFRYISPTDSSNGPGMKEKHQHNRTQPGTHQLSKPSPVPVAHQSTWSCFCKYLAQKKQPKYAHDHRVSDPITVESHGGNLMKTIPTRSEPHPRGLINGPRVEDEMDSNQAAKAYGGLLVTEYYPDPGTKVVRKAYYCY